MLSLAKLSAGATEYYELMVAQGVEEYYANTREAPGQWLGTSAAHLGLDGVVDGDEFRRVLSHTHPTTGGRLTDGKSVPKVVGFDATFCAPKSVSLLFALGAPEVSNEVRSAHDVAVRGAFDMLQSLARGRRDRNGSRLVAGDGLVGAAYRHRTSRAAEPHLHTHVVIPNLVFAPEDLRWSALDARPLYAWCKPVGHLYRAQLRYELTTRLGVQWDPPVNGLAEMAGFNPRVLRAFSTRRREIEQELNDAGRHGAKAAQKAAYKTRAPKDPNLDGSQLLEWWRERATALGLDGVTLAEVTGREPRVRVPAAGSVDADALYAALAAPEGLTAHRSSFDVRHVIEGVCNALPNGGRIDDVLALADGFLSSEHVVALDSQHLAPLRRADGSLVPSGDVLVRFTTPEMVLTEQHLLARAATRRHEQAGITRHDHLNAALTTRPELTDEQVAMVQAVCGSGAGVEVVEGVAGSGKTFALAAAAAAWHASGYTVRGCSLAARAAVRLQDATGIPSTTLDRLLNDLDRGHTSLRARDVVVVDEAAMVGTRKLHQLLDHADRAETKVVLIGDPRQLPEIDAGGAYRALDRTLGSTKLRTNRRQVEPWERTALDRLRRGDTDRALNAYRTNGRIHEHDDARTAIVHTWIAGRLTGHDAVMLAAHVADVEHLNHLARRELQRYGRLRPDEIVIGGRPFAVGDELLALRNAYDVGVLNGTRLTLAYIDSRQGNLHCRDDYHRSVRIPFRYTADGLLTHGYAMTIHKAQGATLTRALVLADDTMTAEHAYTALSRASVRTDLYIDSGDTLEREAHAPTVSTPTAERVSRAFRRSSAQSLAIDHNPQLVPLDALWAERQRLQLQLTGRPADPSLELRRLQQQISSLRGTLEHAIWRQHDAQQRLERLGTVGRHLHRHERKSLKRLEQSAAGDIEHLTARLGPLAAEHHQLTIEQRDVTRWDETHRPELDRVSDIDRTIRLHDIAQHALQHEPPNLSRGAERTMGLELGL